VLGPILGLALLPLGFGDSVGYSFQLLEVRPVLSRVSGCKMAPLVLGLFVVVVPRLFGADATANAFGADVTTVYFVPFEVQTYVPITRDTIVSQAWEQWTISSKSQTAELVALLTHGVSAEYDQDNVRGLVVAGNRQFLIDANGVVSINGRSIQIDKAMLIKFRDSLAAEQRRVLKKNED